MSWWRQLFAAVILAAAINISIAAPTLLAGDCSTPLPGFGESQGNVFNLNVAGPNGVVRPILTWDVFFLVDPDL